MVFGSAGSVMIPVPDTKDHDPIAGAMTALADMVTSDCGVQMERSMPASAAGVFGSFTWIITVSTVMPEAQGPLSTVQVKMF